MATAFGRWLRGMKADLFGPRTRTAARSGRAARLGVEHLEDRSVPATHTWVGGGFTTFWTEGANWLGGVPTSGEASGTVVVFNTVVPNSFQNIAGLVIDQLRFDTGADVNLTLNNDLGINGTVIENNIVDATGNSAIDGTKRLVVQGSTVFIQTSATTGNLSIGTTIAGLGGVGIRKLGAGTLRLSTNTPNTYTGTTTITEGTLLLNTTTGDAGLSNNIVIGDGVGAADEAVLQLGPMSFEIPDAATVTVLGDGRLNVPASTIEDINTLNVNGGQVNIAPTGILEILSAGTVTSNGAPGSIIDGTGLLRSQGTVINFNIADGPADLDLLVSTVIAEVAPANLAKTGAGNLTLSAWNGYSGNTGVSAGVLNVSGPGGSVGPVLVTGGTLGGGGTVGAVTATGGAVAPGLGTSTAALSTGNLILNGSTFAPVIASFGSDRINVTGTVNLTGATLNVIRIGGEIPAGTTFTLINNNGAVDAVVATFAGLPEGATVSVGGQNFTISYTGGDGNDVTLTLQPPPAPPTPPFYSNALMFGDFLVLQGAGVQGGLQIVPMPTGTLAFFSDLSGDGKGDVILFLPTLVLVLDGQTGQFALLSADLNGDGVRDLQVFNPDGTSTRTDGRTGIIF